MALPCNFKETRQITQAHTAVDAAVMAVIAYTGPTPTAAANVGGVTMALWDPSINFTAHDFKFWLDLDTTVDPDSNLTAGVLAIDAGSDDMTFGALATAVNALERWNCVLVGALHTDLI
ncbi:unnamed protein product [marine sediment metagenome]|uniref:Uncharacterized protein n=1 Tax=marine sediment metagenome TaxID=412755 RepID=X0T9W6_9ZZZZ